jgi:hypothetical protein
MNVKNFKSPYSDVAVNWACRPMRHAMHARRQQFMPMFRNHTENWTGKLPKARYIFFATGTSHYQDLT